MRKPLTLSLAVLLLPLATNAAAVPKKAPAMGPGAYRYYTPPTGLVDLPLEIQQMFPQPERSATVVDTFHLAWYNWDDGTPQGWTNVDLGDQVGTFFHVADETELNGGVSGKLWPLEGAKSMWCGQAPSSTAPFCGYVTLPGYGNNWHQFLTSKTLDCDSVVIYYKICWDSEADYDATVVQYWDESDQSWVDLAVNGGAGSYTGTGALDECVMFRVPDADTTSSAVGSTHVRFRFDSDTYYSDADGGYPSDGAVLVDSITVQCWDIGDTAATLIATLFENFEDESPGDLTTGDGGWSAGTLAGYEKLGGVYPGLSPACATSSNNSSTSIASSFGVRAISPMALLAMAQDSHRSRPIFRHSLPFSTSIPGKAGTLGRACTSAATTLRANGLALVCSPPSILSRSL